MQKINNKKLNGGYMMLLMLMIGLVIIVAFIVQTDLFTGAKNKQDVIDNANEAKTNFQNKYKFDPEAAEREADGSN